MVDLAGATHPEITKPGLRGFEIQTAPPLADLPEGFAEFYAPLHARFTPWQHELAAKRKEVLKEVARRPLAAVSARR